MRTLDRKVRKGEKEKATNTDWSHREIAVGSIFLV